MLLLGSGEIAEVSGSTSQAGPDAFAGHLFATAAGQTTKNAAMQTPA
jgi:hypothetical protein